MSEYSKVTDVSDVPEDARADMLGPNDVAVTEGVIGAELTVILGETEYAVLANFANDENYIDFNAALNKLQPVQVPSLTRVMSWFALTAPFAIEDARSRMSYAVRIEPRNAEDIRQQSGMFFMQVSCKF